MGLHSPWPASPHQWRSFATNFSNVTPGQVFHDGLESPAGGRPTMKLDTCENELLDSVEYGEWTSVGRQTRTAAVLAIQKRCFDRIAG
jgi:hypothetical protein